MSRLGSSDWAELLSSRPEFAGKCKWATLEAADWKTLLAAQPQFSKKRKK